MYPAVIRDRLFGRNMDATDGLYTDGACGGGYREEEEDLVPELPFSRKKWLLPIMPSEAVSLCECSHVEWGGVLSVSTKAQMEKKRIISLVLENKYKDSTPGPRDKDWMAGEACIANWSVDKKWYRAQVRIVKKQKKQVWVNFVDYGSNGWCDQKHLRRKLFTTDMPIQSVTIKMDGVVPLNGAMEWPKDALDMLHTMLVDQKVRIRLAPGSTCLPVFASIDFGETNVQQFLVDNEFARWI